MRILRLPTLVRALAASTMMVAASAGATAILPDTETSLQQIICGLYMAEGTSCRQRFNPGSDLGQGGLWQFGDSGLLERANLADDLFSDRSVGRSFGGRSVNFGQFLSAGDSTLFSRMPLNTGYDAMVTFRGDDDSILIGHYRSGPWSKNLFLGGWNDGRGPGGDGDPLPPIIVPHSGLPEPSTLALLGLGLLGVGVLKRRQKKS